MALLDLVSNDSSRETAGAFALQEGSGSWLLPLPVRVPSMVRQWAMEPCLSARTGLDQLGDGARVQRCRGGGLVQIGGGHDEGWESSHHEKRSKLKVMHSHGRGWSVGSGSLAVEVSFVSATPSRHVPRELMAPRRRPIATAHVIAEEHLGTEDWLPCTKLVAAPSLGQCGASLRPSAGHAVARAEARHAGGCVSVSCSNTGLR